MTRPLAAVALVVALAGGLAFLLPRGREAPADPARSRLRPLVFEVADGLAAVAVGRGDLWVGDPVGERLLRVDGIGGRVRAALRVRGRVAVSTGRAGVWVLQAGGDYGAGLRGPLLRVDPRTNRVRARVSLGGVLGFGVVARGRGAWVWGPRDVLRVDAHTRRVARRIRVGDEHGELRGLAVYPRALVAVAADGRLIRLDPHTGRRTGSIAVPLVAPRLRAVLGRRLVLSSEGSVALADAGTGRVAWRRRLGFRVGAVVPARGLLWVHSAARNDAGDRLSALDPDTGRVRESVLLPAFGTTGMARRRDRLWLPTAGGRMVVVGLPPRAG